MDKTATERKSKMSAGNRGGAVIEQVKRCICVGMLGGKYETLHDQTRRVYATDGCAPTQHTVGGGNLETKIYELSDTMKRYIGSRNDKYQVSSENLKINRAIACSKTTREGCSRADTSDYICPAMEEDTQLAQNQDLSDYRIRKLTERECFRLMGVKDEDFDKIKPNQSKSKLYHLAGDSIVTTCLMALFGQMLDVDWEEKIREVTK